MKLFDRECDSCGDDEANLTEYEGQLLCKVCKPIAVAIVTGPCAGCGLIHTSEEC